MSTTGRPVQRSGAPWRYLLVGGATFVLDFALLWFLVELTRVPTGLSGAVAFLAITAFNFLGQWRVTFRSTSSPGRSLVRYLLLLLANTVATAAAVELSQAWLGHFSVGKIVISALIVLWNYPLMDRWVYPATSDVRRWGRGAGR